MPATKPKNTLLMIFLFQDVHKCEENETCCHPGNSIISEPHYACTKWLVPALPYTGTEVVHRGVQSAMDNRDESSYSSQPDRSQPNRGQPDRDTQALGEINTKNTLHVTLGSTDLFKDKNYEQI